MADAINVLTGNDNENGTANAIWTPRDQIDDGKKVLMGKIGELSGNMEAFWGTMDSIEPVLIEKLLLKTVHITQPTMKRMGTARLQSMCLEQSFLRVRIRLN